MRRIGAIVGEVARKLGSFVRRHPFVAAVAGVVLAFSLWLAPDFFYAIPWPIRQAGGYAIFSLVGVLCLRRILTIRGGDDVVPAESPRSAWWSTLTPLALCALLAIPFLEHPENYAGEDWDLNLQKYESVRKTIVEWGQFPWWDPWCRGGFPLAANPQCGVFGVATPLVVIFGTSVGMRLATLVCLLIATEGARRLALLWVGDSLAAIACGLIYGLNGAVILQAIAGYHLPMSYCAFPWLLLHAFRLDRRPSEGIGLGFWLAFDVLNGINYFSVYAVLILSVVWLRAARVRSGSARRRYLIHTALAIGVMLLLSGWRLGTTASVYRDFPRPFASYWYETPVSILRHLLNRPNVAASRSQIPYFWETTCYIGPIALGLALLSLGRGWRWWHTLTLVCGLLAVGASAWFHPSFWLGPAPLFSSMHVVTRWRVMAMLGVGLAAADLLARWRTSPSKALRWLAVAAVLGIAVDYLHLGNVMLRQPFRVEPSESHFPGPKTAEIIQVDREAGFPSVLRGYGFIPMQEPLLGYERTAPTARLWRGLPGYRGESWTDSGPIRPRFWSPNRIEFQVEPGATVHINQNPGSWWWANGRPVAPSSRSAETLLEFSATADSRGVLILEIRPKGLRFGLGLHVAGLVLTAVSLVVSLRGGFSPLRAGERGR